MVAPPRGTFWKLKSCHKRGLALIVKNCITSLQMSLQEICVLEKPVYNTWHLELNYLAYKH